MKTLSKLIFTLCLVTVGIHVGPSVAFAQKVDVDPSSVTMNEDVDEEIIEVRLDSPIIVQDGDDPWVTIDISSDDSRVEINPTSIVFLHTEWHLTKTFTITTVGDEILNPDNDAEVTLLVVSDSVYYDGFETSVSVTLVDDEADTTPPDTFLLSSSTDASVASFEFAANEEPTTFECSIDEDIFTPCTSPYLTSPLLNGGHSFEVRAIDASLNTDPSPAIHTWYLAEPIDVWHLDATSGDFAIDSWESDNDGIVSGAQNWTTGRVNNAFSFDGTTSNYITIDRPVEDDLTICAWIKTETVGGDTDHWRLAPIMESEVATRANDFGFGVDGNGYLAYGNGGAYDETVNGTTLVNDNKWHHTCVTRNQTTGEVVLYVDGDIDATGTTDTATLDDNTNAYIGYGTDGAVPFKGLMDEIFVYNSVLSDEYILSLYQDTLPTVDSVSPADRSTEINVDDSLIITFTEPMDTGSLVISTGPCEEECATYDVIWSENDTVVELIKSNGSFAYKTTYTIEIEADDVNGNEMAEPHEWSFTTDAPPSRSSATTKQAREQALKIWDAYYADKSAPEISPSLDVSLLVNRLTRLGDRGPHVVQLQKILNIFGYTLDTDGIFGPMTQSAVKSLQTKLLVTPDGIVGSMTLNAIINNYKI
jgi:hypothetical protein